MKDRIILLWAAALASGLAIFPVVQRLLLLPIYFSDGGESHLLALVNRLNSMLVLPGKVLVYRVWPPPEHYFTTPQLLLAAVFNFAIYFLLIILLWGGLIQRRRQASRRLAAAPPKAVNAEHGGLENPGRRAFMATAATSAFGLTVFASGAYPVLFEPGWLTVRRVRVPIKGLPPSLAGITIAQLTDFHHDEWISLHHVRDAVQLANSLRPDLIALTGDYVTSNPALIKPAVAELTRLSPRLGTVAVLGNHDWWSDVKETRRRFADANIPLIDNGRRFLTADRKLVDSADVGLCIGGVGDLWEDEVSPEKAFDKIPDEMPRILLSHNPDVAEDHRIVREFTRVDLMVCGHTHGGQVRLPGFGTPIVPSAYGPKYAQGLVKGPGCAVQISAGIGLAMLPVRLNVRPEIVLMSLESA